MRPIDADALKNRLQKGQAAAFADNNVEAADQLGLFIATIDFCPTIEVRSGMIDCEDVPPILADLIDRSALTASLFPLYNKDAADIYRIVEDAPAVNCGVSIVDTSPKRCGKWVYDETIGGMKYYYCTNCKEHDTGNECIADENQILWFTFCPKCGAKMDVETYNV